MFINTVQANNNFETGNNSYDSRVTKRKKAQTENEIILIDKEKLMNIITLYSHNMPVTCLLKCKNEEVIGIPTNISGDEVDVIVDSDHVKVKLCNILELNILKF